MCINENIQVNRTIYIDKIENIWALELNKRVYIYVTIFAQQNYIIHTGINEDVQALEPYKQVFLTIHWEYNYIIINTDINEGVWALNRAIHTCMSDNTWEIFLTIHGQQNYI